MKSDRKTAESRACQSVPRWWVCSILEKLLKRISFNIPPLLQSPVSTFLLLPVHHRKVSI